MKKLWLKRLLSTLLSATMVVGMLPTSALAADRLSELQEKKPIIEEEQEGSNAKIDEDTPTSGTCGDNLTWSFNIDTGTLTISGLGNMEDFSNSVYAPWEQYEKQIKTVLINDGVTSIGQNAFSYGYDNVIKIVIPKTVTKINLSAFSQGLSGIKTAGPIGEGFNYEFGWETAIPDRAFSGFDINNIKLPDTIEKIGDSAFENCSFAEISLPSGLQEISYHAFSSCKNLINITIPDTVTKLGEGVFYSCDSLKSVVLPQNITEIPESFFWGCNSLETIQLPSSVKCLGDWCFAHCNSMNDITIPASVTSIGQYAFYYCESFYDIQIPDTVLNIGSGTFSECRNLRTISFSQNITVIADSMFEGCDNLLEFNIPDKVISIGDSAFSHCNKLQTISFPNSVKIIGRCAFTSCDTLSSVCLPQCLEEIQTETFYYCDNLKSIVIPKSVRSIGTRALDYCKNLADVYFEGSQDEWKSIFKDDYLTDVTIHYNSTGPDDPGLEEGENSYLVDVFTSYDVENKQAIFGFNPDIYTYQVTDETDLSFLNDIDNLLNKYVFVQYRSGEYGTSDMLTNYVLSIQPVESYIGTPHSAGDHTLTFNGTEYPVNESIVPAIYLNKMLLYHIYNGTIIGISVLEKKSGILESWDRKKGTITIDGTVYVINYLSDLSDIDINQIEIGKQIVFYTLNEANASGHLPMLKMVSVTYPGGDINEFNPTIYRANYLHSKAELPAQQVNDSITQTTPSETFVEALQESGAVNMMTVWESFELISEAVDDPTALYDFVAEPKDLYSAVILNALEASVSYDVISSDVENALKDCDTFVSTVKDWMNNLYGIDIQQANDFKSLTDNQRMKLAELAEAWFKEKEPDLCSIADVLGKISTGMKVVGSIEDYFERIVSCAIVVNTNEYMKDVMRQVYQDSLSVENIYLQSALADCVKIMDSSTEEVIEKIISDEFVVVGTDAAKYLIKELLWDQVTKTLYATHPAVAVFQAAYKTGKFVSNLLFNTDDTIEQYAKMDAIVDIENLVDKTYKKLGTWFANQQDVESAEMYLNGIDLIFALRHNDSLRAYELVDILDNSLVNKIQELFGSDAYSDIKNYLRIRQVKYTVEHEAALTAWIDQLGVDYPNSELENQYGSWFEQSTERISTKEFVAACPVNVYVYNSSGKLIASVSDNRVSCEDPNIMIALMNDTKIVRFYGDQNYYIEYVGTDTGTMDVTISEFDDNEEIVRKINYYDISLEDNAKYKVDVNAGQEKQLYNFIDEAMGSSISSDYDSLAETNTIHNVSIQSGSLLHNGEIFLTTKANAGETMNINAYIPQGFEFIHWESSNGEDIFEDYQSESTIFIMPDEDIVIKAIIQPNEEITSPDSGDGSSSSNGVAHSSSSSTSNCYKVSVQNGINNGTIHVSPSYAEYGNTVTITVTPNKGYELDKLVVYDEDGDQIALTNKGNGKYTFEMPKSEVEIEASFAAIKKETSKADFIDVAANAWYADAVQYVYKNGMMSGTSKTTFSPNLTTTRGMIVTILYRLENEPAVTGTTAFTDVAADQYYANAVTWAAQNGIVSGTTVTTFAPNNAITREQMAAILYRYAQFKGYDVLAKADLSTYTDAVNINAYATDAMTWANCEQLITGTSATTLTPAGNATRAQVATILMRFCENIAK